MYNGEPYLSHTLSSVLKQCTRPDEVIVSDNASTDKTPEVIGNFAARASFPICVVQQPENIGSIRNIANAAALVKTTFFTILPADDLLDPTFVARFKEVAVEIPPT